MAGDREARILGAGEKITVEDKEYILRPVVAQHLCDLERDALRYYKQQVIDTYSQNIHLIDNGMDLLKSKLEEVSCWGIDDLPQKDAYDCSRVPITDELKLRMETLFGEISDNETTARNLLSNALTTKSISLEEIEKLTGRKPIVGRVRYDQWWVTSVTEGMVSFISSSLKRDHPEVNGNSIRQWPFTKLIEASGIVESLSVADLGNTSA